MALKPFWGTYKDEQTGISHPTDAATGQVVQEVQPFLGAHQVESVDPRLAAYDADTGTLHGVRYQQLTAVSYGGNPGAAGADCIPAGADHLIAGIEHSCCYGVAYAS